MAAKVKSMKSLSAASDAVLDRKYPNVDQVVEAMVLYEVGKVLNYSRAKIADGDLTVKQAISGGRFHDNQIIFNDSQVKSLHQFISPHTLNKDLALKDVLKKIEELLTRNGLRSDLDALGLMLKAYSPYVYSNDLVIGIVR